MDRGGWWATVCEVAESRTRLKGLNTYTHTQIDKKKTETEIKGKCYFPSHPKGVPLAPELSFFPHVPLFVCLFKQMVGSRLLQNS